MEISNIVHMKYLAQCLADGKNSVHINRFQNTHKIHVCAD